MQVAGVGYMRRASTPTAMTQAPQYGHSTSRSLGRSGKGCSQPHPYLERRGSGKDTTGQRRSGHTGTSPTATCTPLDHGARLGANSSYFRDAG